MVMQCELPLFAFSRNYHSVTLPLSSLAFALSCPPQNAGKYMLYFIPSSFLKKPCTSRPPVSTATMVFLNAELVRSLTGRKQKALEILFLGYFMGFLSLLFVSGHWSSRIIWTEAPSSGLPCHCWGITRLQRPVAPCREEARAPNANALSCDELAHDCWVAGASLRKNINAGANGSCI